MRKPIRSTIHRAESVVSPPPPPPPTGANFNMGAKTRQGFGGFPSGLAAGTALAGTHAAFFKIDDMGHIVPAAAGVVTYGAAWTPPIASGVTTLTAGGLTFNITIVANAAHIRERYATGGVNQDLYSADDDFGPPWSCQLGKQLINNTYLALGDTIWCRDGHFNPEGRLFYIQPSVGYTGSGSITIRSETVDVTNDANGNPNRKHGFKVGKIHWLAKTDVSLPFIFRDIQFLQNVAVPASNVLFSIAQGYGLTFGNCSFSSGPLVTDATESLAVNNTRGPVTVDDCSFYKLGQGISSSYALAARRNVMEFIYADFFFIDRIGHEITDNFGFNLQGFVPFHPDCIQHTGFNGSGDIGVIQRNIFAIDRGSQPSQGVYFDSAGGTYTAVNVRNNLILTCGLNGVFFVGTSNIDCKYNTCLQDISFNTTDTPAMYVAATGPGSGGSFQYNLGNSINWSAQTGAVTITPASPQVLAKTNAAYDAALPNIRAWMASGVRTYAAAKAACIPANLARASGGAKETSGIYNGALKASGAWNDGAP